MNSRHRILSAILAAGLVISLTGCAEKETLPETSVTSGESTVSTTSTPESKPAESTTQSTATTPESKPAESTSDTSTAEPTTSSTSSAPQSMASAPASKPAESKPTESKPEQSVPSSSTKPTENKPTESAPVEDTSPDVGIVLVTSKFNHQKWSEKVRAIEAGEIEIDPTKLSSDRPSSIVIPEGATGEYFDQYGNPMPEDFDPSYGGYYDCEGVYQLTPEEYVQDMRDRMQAYKEIEEGTFDGTAGMTQEEADALLARLGL